MTEQCRRETAGSLPPNLVGGIPPHNRGPSFAARLFPLRAGNRHQPRVVQVCLRWFSLAEPEKHRRIQTGNRKAPQGIRSATISPAAEGCR